MEIRCHNCQKIFKADSQQKLLIDTARKNNQRLIFIECSKCFKDVPIDPNNLLSKIPQKDEDKKNKSIQAIKCPICQEGIVTYIDTEDEKFWGCGECGNVWFSKEDLGIKSWI